MHDDVKDLLNITTYEEAKAKLEAHGIDLDDFTPPELAKEVKSELVDLLIASDDELMDKIQFYGLLGAKAKFLGGAALDIAHKRGLLKQGDGPIAMLKTVLDRLKKKENANAE